MSNFTVLRSNFQAAIEAGIAQAEFQGEIADRLREVGRTAVRIGFGNFVVTEPTGSGEPVCYCPLVTAGLTRPDGMPLHGLSHYDVGHFARTFDDYLAETTGAPLDAAVESYMDFGFYADIVDLPASHV